MIFVVIIKGVSVFGIGQSSLIACNLIKSILSLEDYRE